jgi:molybdenum cofactor cytidylyltransferase
VAGIILAAGESSRFDQIKQLAKFSGKTFIENVIETALQSALSSLYVVLGANRPFIEPVLKKYARRIGVLENSDWPTGQSSSIRVAVNSLQINDQAAMFLLVDQPQIRSELINSLLVHYEEYKPSILAPFVGERRGNPVLFDRICFKRLSQLEGNQGGRTLFSDFEVTQLDWQNKEILLDVDTPEDYLKLKDSYE